MHYPQLKLQSLRRRTLEAFGGYNRSQRIGEGEFSDMRNLTSDHYPVLAPRARRGIYAAPASPQGLIAKESLCYVDGSRFLMGDTAVDLGLSVEPGDCPKQLVSMGAYVIILPDKKYINTINPQDHGSLEAAFTAEGTVTLTLCDESGGAYDPMTVSPAPPEAPQNGDFWLDTSGRPNRLLQYAAGSGTWVAVESTFLRIGAAGIGRDFEIYDGVTLSGIEGAAELNGSAVIRGKGDDYILIPGILEEALTQEGGLTVRRAMPPMDFLVESGNRLWGCRYGHGSDGRPVNELYASKLGDFKNWNCFMGLSTDSYAASVGSDGPFTGAVAYLGTPLFFKEQCLHRVYGRYPAAFQIQETPCRGVQRGCGRSLAVVNETLFYKSTGGICAYDGSLPVDVSQALGKTPYHNAVGGAAGSKYYVSMEDESGGWHLFVYDTERALWHREDDLQAAAFCTCAGQLYCIDGGGRNILTLLSGSDEGPVKWMAQTGELGLGSHNMKYLSALNLRLWLDRGSKAEVFVQYAPEGAWLPVCTVFSTDLRSFTVPIRPRRSDHFRLRLEGQGDARVYSITKTIAEGSDLS